MSGVQLQGNQVKRGKAVFTFRGRREAVAMARLWEGGKLTEIAATFRKPVQQDIELGPLFSAPKPARKVAA